MYDSVFVVNNCSTFNSSLSPLPGLFMLCWSEWECLLLSGSQLPSEQLKLSSSSSPPFTAGLPHPPPSSFIWWLSPRIHQTDSHTHTCMPACALKIQTHTGQTEVVRLCFYAVTQWVCVIVAQEETGTIVAPTTCHRVVYASFHCYHFTTCDIEPQTRHKLWVVIQKNFHGWADGEVLQMSALPKHRLTTAWLPTGSR